MIQLRYVLWASLILNTLLLGLFFSYFFSDTWDSALILRSSSRLCAKLSAEGIATVELPNFC